jgi:adenylate cyclase
MYGELVPQGGGDAIPLLKKTLLLGRRESCDIVLRFSNVSAHHCELSVVGGYWYVHDKNSRNGVKVNGIRVTDKRIDPGDVLSVAKHRYEVHYSPAELGAVGPPPPDEPGQEIFGKSLLERAGLQKEPRVVKPTRPKPLHEGAIRYDITNDEPDQIRKRNHPI